MTTPIEPPRDEATNVAAVAWSGGKDACLAWRRAVDQGLLMRTFLTMCDADGLSKAHALPPALIAAQARAAGVEWRAALAGPGEYAEVFDAALRRLRDEGHRHLVFGDIDLAAHRDWLAPRCRAAGLEAVFPLWAEPRAALAREVIARGIRARLVCVDTRWLDASFCGADYDDALLGRLPAGVCPCGEEGEFHTFVFDAPGFARPLRVVDVGPRRVASQPPLRPTEFVLSTLSLLDGEAAGSAAP